VREGGGIAGTHAVTFTNNNWPEFADLMGGWAGKPIPTSFDILIGLIYSPFGCLTESRPRLTSSREHSI
jgi:hypothetical protein